MSPPLQHNSFIGISDLFSSELFIILPAVDSAGLLVFLYKVAPRGKIDWSMWRVGLAGFKITLCLVSDTSE